MKILLDSGHGGKDPGAVNQDSGVQEKDIALEVVLKLAVLLRAAGHNALLTRDKDIYISPSDRWKMINNFNPEAFISIHCNSHANLQAHGIETIYRDDEDYLLAGAIHKSLLANTDFKDRGIKQEQSSVYPKNLMVIEDKGRIPSCLVEIGFLSNESDLSKIDEEDEQQAIAEAIAEGVVEWA